MAFVKLDCGILDSTLWVDRLARELFITALLMAEPREIKEPAAQIDVRSLDTTGFIAPPGWYGFVPAAGIGIIRRAGIEDIEAGMKALEKLGSPEQDSRTPDHDGRRMVRIDGGYLVLNYDKYRQRDYTAAERSRRYRKRKTSRVTSRDAPHKTRDITQAEAEAEAAESLSLPREASGSEPSVEIPPVSLENAISRGEEMAISKTVVEQWWHARDAIGWLRKQQPITRWQSDLTAFNASYQRNEHSNKSSHGTHKQSDRTRGSGTIGTCNEGKSAQYRGIKSV